METQTEDVLATLQAQLTVQQMALRALVRTHPDPVALMSAWRETRADAVAASYAGPPGARPDGRFAELVDALAEQWTGVLAERVLGIPVDPRS